MSFNSEQLAYAGVAAINYFLKNDPIDQVNVERPLIKRLTAEQQAYAGGLQYVVEQLRFSNDSNFQSYFGDQQVTYNRKRTLMQAKYTWGAFHDGFGLNEDELTQNGIQMTDDKDAVPTDAERVQITNLFKENMDTLKLGFQENFDYMLHRDGTQSATNIPGLDFLVSTAGTGVVGGIDSTANTWWQNSTTTGVAAGATLVTAMEQAWRQCIRVGGSPPNFIPAGSAFIDAYRTSADTTINRQIIIGSKDGNKNPTTMDASIGAGIETGLFFKGVPVEWDPVMDELETMDAPAISLAKRCYFLNTRFIKLRPIKGHWMVARKPPRV
ncbi:MAG: phage major capsid protein, partial [Steroidobacteraceae bacterium]